MPIPLTGSLYAPGKLKHPGTVLVDVGTGYFVEKTHAQSVAYAEKRQEMLRRNNATAEDTLAKKKESLQVTVSLIQSRVAQMQQGTVGGARG